MGINEEIENNNNNTDSYNNYSRDIDTNRNLTSYALSGGKKSKTYKKVKTYKKSKPYKKLKTYKKYNKYKKSKKNYK